MLTIHEEQIEAFEQHLFVDMRQRVERAIAETFPELSGQVAPGVERVTGPAPQLGVIVRRGIESAVNFGVGDGPDFAAFIALGLAVRLTPPGPGGDWIYAYLNRPATSGSTKLRMIESQLASAAEEDAAFGEISKRVAQARARAAG